MKTKRLKYVLLCASIALIASLVFVLAACRSGDFDVKGEAKITLVFDKEYPELFVSCPEGDISAKSVTEYEITLASKKRVDVAISAANYKTRILTFETSTLIKQPEQRADVSLEAEYVTLEITVNGLNKYDDIRFNCAKEGVIKTVKNNKSQFTLEADITEPTDIIVSCDGYIDNAICIDPSSVKNKYYEASVALVESESDVSALTVHKKGETRYGESVEVYDFDSGKRVTSIYIESSAQSGVAFLDNTKNYVVNLNGENHILSSKKLKADRYVEVYYDVRRETVMIYFPHMTDGYLSTIISQQGIYDSSANVKKGAEYLRVLFNNDVYVGYDKYTASSDLTDWDVNYVMSIVDPDITLDIKDEAGNSADVECNGTNYSDGDVIKLSVLARHGIYKNPYDLDIDYSDITDFKLKITCSKKEKVHVRFIDSDGNAVKLDRSCDENGYLNIESANNAKIYFSPSEIANNYDYSGIGFYFSTEIFEERNGEYYYDFKIRKIYVLSLRLTGFNLSGDAAFNISGTDDNLVGLDWNNRKISVAGETTLQLFVMNTQGQASGSIIVTSEDIANGYVEVNLNKVR